jgi:hypothetical protein
VAPGIGENHAFEMVRDAAGTGLVDMPRIATAAGQADRELPPDHLPSAHRRGWLTES